MLKQLKTIIRKEILDAIRDRKSFATPIFFSVLFALVMFGTTTFLVKQQNEVKNFSILINGAESGRPLVDWLEKSGITLIKADNDGLQQVKTHKHDMLLVLPRNFNEKLNQNQQVTVELFSDQSAMMSQGKVLQVQNLINQFSANTGKQRLIERKLNPEIANPVTIKSTNVAGDQKMAARVIGSLPLVLMIIAFISGIGMSSDMAAGEREKRTLEPLLANPVSHASIFIGKWFAGALVTFIIACTGIVLQFISVKKSPLAELGLHVNLGTHDFFLILLILIPVIIFASSLQLLVSFLARSFKDSQYYSQLVVFLPMLPGLYLTYNSGLVQTSHMMIPILGAQALLVNVISGDAVSIAHIILAGINSLIMALICTAMGIFLLKREKTIFS